MTDDLINFIDEDDVVESQRDHSVEPWLVLMVDDDNDVHTVTRMSLGGFVVNERLITLKSAFTGQEALDMVCQKGARLPDLVLMDVVMATPTDGIDTARTDDRRREPVRPAPRAHGSVRRSSGRVSGGRTPGCPERRRRDAVMGYKTHKRMGEALLRVKHVEFTMQGFEILAVHPH